MSDETHSAPATASSGVLAPPAPVQQAFFGAPRDDLIAGSVVFLVALPLCLGIAVASHAPPLAGIVSGIVGGLVVPLISRSPLSVSGPAAGLTAIVVTGIQDLGSFPAFLTAVVVGGLFQALFGVLRSGALAAIVPASVIQAMLTAIGVILVMKQMPLVLGLHEGTATPGPILIAAVSLGIIMLWPRSPFAKVTWMSSSLIVVVVGTLLAALFERLHAPLALTAGQLIQLPPAGDVVGQWRGPDLAALKNPQTWTIGLTIALVASIETLLSVEALDRMDPLRRKTPKNRELVAQGVANMTAGVLGGLPITAVVVRSSANIQAGGKGRLSAMFHGALLVLSVLVLAPLLNHVPIAALAAILLHVGLRLAAPKAILAQLKQGPEAWVPFTVTLVAVVATDLLKGVTLGFLVSILVVLKHATRDTVVVERAARDVTVRFLRDGTFLVKPALVGILDGVQDGERVIIECGHVTIDGDVKETIAAFCADAHRRNITVDVRGLDITGVALSSH